MRLNIQTLSIVRHAGKIRMRLAARGAPVAVKRRAVYPDRTLKLLPVFDLGLIKLVKHVFLDSTGIKYFLLGFKSLLHRFVP
jgi:hypothetical protein